MGRQLGLAAVVALPNGNERYLWRTDPRSAFAAWLRTYLYTPRTPNAQGRTLPKRHFSADTQRSYAAMFGQFVAYLATQEIHLIDADARQVAAYLDALPGRQDGKASIVTVRRTLNMLDHAFNKLVELGLRRDNPVKPLIGTAYTVQEKSPHSSVLLKSQHDELLARIDAIPRTSFESARRAALLAVAIGCGVCGDELRRLKVSQLALGEDAPLLTMPEHGLRTEVSLPLADHTVRILRDWCAVRAEAGARGELLFPAAADRDEPISLQTLHRYAVAALEEIGRTERTGAQRVLRASFAVRQLAKRPPDEVRRWLRLRTDKMIERYQRQVVRPDQRIV
jgi:site-specific recombinase XerD